MYIDTNLSTPSIHEHKPRIASPQFGNHTLPDLKHAVRREMSELLSFAISGGILGVLPEEGFSIHFVSDPLLNCLGYQYEEFLTESHGRLIDAVHPDERDALLDALSVIKLDSRVEHPVRLRCRNGDYRWMRLVGKHSHDPSACGVLLLLCIDITESVEIRQALEQKASALEERSRELVALTANIPGGVCEVALDDGFSMLYGNEGFYSLYGHTPAQFVEFRQNCLSNVIHWDDIEPVRAHINDAKLDGMRSVDFEHRIFRMDGTMAWVLVRGNFSLFRGVPALSCVVIDITDRKQMEQDLRINEERFRIAFSQIDSTIFDYDILTREMIHSDKSADRYGLNRITENVPHSLVENGIIHPESAETFLGMYDKICNGVSCASCVIRARLADGDYAWHKISMTNIYDENGAPIRAVGMLEDIDAQTRREQELLRQSERDTLTHLYNRGATEFRIDEYLHAQKQGTLNALFIIDIDLFKQVNDSYGHLFGDFVLIESANRIARLFHGQDVIGRIGGDEFIVFMSSLPTAAIARKRAQQICRAFQTPFGKNGTDVQISCSIGIAFCPEHGQNFQQLYEKSDVALYHAKRDGKNKSVCFSPEMRNGEWVPYSNTKIDGVQHPL